MKKHIFLLFAFVLVLVNGVTAQETGINGFIASDATRLAGDVNGDGQVGIADVTEIIDFILLNASDDFIVANADVDGDERVTIADITSLIDIILGNPEVQPSLTATPTTIDFGEVPVGESRSAFITLTGENLTEPIFTSIAETYGGEFSVSPTTLPANGGRVRVTYTPDGAHSSSAQLLFNSGNKNVRVLVNGKGVVPSTINTDKDTLDFGTVAKGNTETRTLTVTGNNLSGNLTLTCTGSYFLVSPTTITPTQAAGGKVVTVIYSPSIGSIHGDTGILTISGGGAESKTVILTGKCAGIEVTPSSYDFGPVLPGGTQTKTFRVTGYNLEGSISIVSPYEDEFTIVSPTSMTLPASGGNVTVTYKPEAAGNHDGFFRASCQSVSATANYTGKCTDITISKSSLDFGTIANGDSKDLTLTVTGVNLSGNLSLTCTGSFSVNPTTIIKDSSNNASGTVTVTYHPTATGTHTGTLTISDGKVSKTVSLTGTSAKITISPTSWSFGPVLPGGTETKTFKVTGSNIGGAISIVSPYEDEFRIVSPTSMTLPASGGNVTVTYRPEAAGNHDGWFKASYQSVSATANYTGKCTNITTSKSSLDFGTIANGDSKDLTLTVTGVNLSGNLSLTCTGSYFSVNPTSITKNSSNNASGTVTMTYNPTVAGSHTGTLTISDGKVSKTVSLTGNSGQITITPSTWDFGSVLPGESATKTFKVTGTNIGGTISIVSPYEDKFLVTPTSLPATGGNVTVSYKPEAVGNHDGWFKASYMSVNAMATFSGECTAPTITVNPTSLSFGSHPIGTASQRTFIVKGTNLTGDLSVSSSSSNIFSVRPTTITKAQAESGATVTVTFKPLVVKQYTGTITVSGGGAEAKTVSVLGKGIEEQEY